MYIIVRVCFLNISKNKKKIFSKIFKNNLNLEKILINLKQNVDFTKFQKKKI